MFRPATASDLPGIIALWQEAFGDPPAAAAGFFRAFPNCLSYVAEDNGAVVSMVHALPQVLSPDIPAAYIYAVATAWTHRGLGLCRQLMDFAEADLQARGFACCALTPGEESLFRFYDRLGYRTAFTRRRVPFSGGRPIAMEDYLVRRAQLLTEPHMVCDQTTAAYAAGVYGLRFYETDTGIAAAGSDYTAEVLPEDVQGVRAPFAMLKWLTRPRPFPGGYLGFALE